MNKTIILPIGNIFPISRSGTSARSAISFRSPNQEHMPDRLSVPCKPGIPVYKFRGAPGSPRVLQLQLPLPSPGQLRGRHVSCVSSSRCPTRGSSGAATCPASPAPAVQPGAAPGPPRVLRLQLPLPIPGQLRGRHVPCGSSPGSKPSRRSCRGCRRKSTRLWIGVTTTPSTRRKKVSPPLFADLFSRVRVSLSLFCVLNPDANLRE
jgi:hypothetical protein